MTIKSQSKLIAAASFVFFLVACQNDSSFPQKTTTTASSESSSSSSWTSSAYAEYQEYYKYLERADGPILTSLKDVPFTIDLGNLPVVVRMNRAPIGPILDQGIIDYAETIKKDPQIVANNCALKQPLSFYKQMHELYADPRVQSTSYHLNIDTNGTELEYVSLTFYPNLLHETTAQEATLDFVGCNQKGVAPNDISVIAVNTKWIVFTNKCSRDSVECPKITDAIKTFKLK